MIIVSEIWVLMQEMCKIGLLYDICARLAPTDAHIRHLFTYSSISQRLIIEPCMNKTLLLTSCSYGTAALALGPSLLTKYTHSAGHRGMSICIPLNTYATQWLLNVLALFLMFRSTRVCESECIYACVRQTPPWRHPLFFRTSSPVLRGVMTQA